MLLTTHNVTATLRKCPAVRAAQTAVTPGAVAVTRVGSNSMDTVNDLPLFCQESVEEWRAIPGFEPYEASNLGRLRNPNTGRLISTKSTCQGYPRAWPYFCGRRRCLFAHRAVLLAFVGLPPPDCEARHLNGVRADNRLKNLCWGTRLENASDRARHGTNKIGERNPMARATDEEVAEAVRMMRLGLLTPSQAGRRIGYAPGTMYDIRDGKNRCSSPVVARVLKEIQTPVYRRGNGSARLREDEVRAIKVALRAGEKLSAIAPRYGVSIGCISDIKRGVKWGWMNV